MLRAELEAHPLVGVAAGGLLVRGAHVQVDVGPPGTDGDPCVEEAKALGEIGCARGKTLGEKVNVHVEVVQARDPAHGAQLVGLVPTGRVATEGTGGDVEHVYSVRRSGLNGNSTMGLVRRGRRPCRAVGHHGTVAIEHDERPWGHYTVLDDAVGHKVKRIVVLPGRRLSYQRHSRRAEHWFVVQGRAKVTLDGQAGELGAGQAVDVPTGTAHRIENVGHDELVFIEVQHGEYFGEDDIVRLEDDFGRGP